MSDILDKYMNAFFDDEYEKAVSFYEFLKEISKCNGGILRIDREKFIKLAMVIMNCDDVYKAYEIVKKMLANKMIIDLKKDYVIVNIK